MSERIEADIDLAVIAGDGIGPEVVAEVCATVRRGERTSAIALRLEGISGRWCCTDLAGL